MEDVSEGIAFLPQDILQVLGNDPSTSTSKDVRLHPALASRWKSWISSGIDSDEKIKLLSKYSPKLSNISLEAPILNPEVASSLTASSKKKENASLRESKPTWL